MSFSRSWIKEKRFKTQKDIVIIWQTCYKILLKAKTNFKLLFSKTTSATQFLYLTDFPKANVEQHL